MQRPERGARDSRPAASNPAPQPAASNPASQAANSEPAPEPPPPAALDIDAAAAWWPAVVDLVRGENAMLAALLSDARPVAVHDRELTVAFPGGAAFLKKKAEQEDYRRAAGEALQAVTGQRLVLRYELRDGEEKPAGDTVLSGEELVRRFMEEFDAEEVLEDESNEGEVKG